MRDPKWISLIDENIIEMVNKSEWQQIESPDMTCNFVLKYSQKPDQIGSRYNRARSITARPQRQTLVTFSQPDQNPFRNKVWQVSTVIVKSNRLVNSNHESRRHDFDFIQTWIFKKAAYYVDRLTFKFDPRKKRNKILSLLLAHARSAGSGVCHAG